MLSREDSSSSSRRRDQNSSGRVCLAAGLQESAEGDSPQKRETERGKLQQQHMSSGRSLGRRLNDASQKLKGRQRQRYEFWLVVHTVGRLLCLCSPPTLLPFVYSDIWKVVPYAGNVEDK